MEQKSNTKYIQTLATGLDVMLASGQHADVTIVVDGRVFPCHKVILCALSPYFEAMFSHDMIETRGGIVTLHDIDPDVFGALLKFVYTGKEVVDERNAERMFRASSLLQISCLQEKCEEFLLTQVSHENCVGIWRIAKSHSCKNLAKKSLEVILENFTQVSSAEEFLQLEVDELADLIRSDDLKCVSEENVCDVVVTWLKSDVVNRQQHVGRLLEVLRLPLVSSDYLFYLLDDEYFDVPVESNVYVKEALKFHACPAKVSNFTSSRTIQRKHSQENDVLIVVGGLLKSIPRFQTTKEVISYSFQQEKWFYLPSLPYDPGYEFAVCSHGRNVYLSGGWLKLQGMMEYKGHKNKWKVCPSMVKGRCGHVMVNMANSLFTLGGRDGKAPAMTNIEEYNLQLKKWTSAGEMLVGVRSMSAASVGESILIFGGITENDKDTDAIQCFDTRTRAVTIIGDLPFSCRLTRTINCEDTIYVALPDGRLVRFDSKASRERLQSISSISDLAFLSENEEEKSDVATSVRDTTLSIVKEIPSPTARISGSPSTSRSPRPSSGSGAHVLGKVRGKIQGLNQHHFEAVQHRGQLLLAGGKTPDNTILKTILNVDPVKMEVTSTVEMPSPRWCFGLVKTVLHKDYLSNNICDGSEGTV